MEIDERKFLDSIHQISDFNMQFPTVDVLETFYECCGIPKAISMLRARNLVNKWYEEKFHSRNRGDG